MYVAASDCVLFIIRIFLKLLQAREERLIREIMAVDNISWLLVDLSPRHAYGNNSLSFFLLRHCREEAEPKFLHIVERNRVGLSLLSLPYKVCDIP